MQALLSSCSEFRHRQSKRRQAAQRYNVTRIPDIALDSTSVRLPGVAMTASFGTWRRHSHWGLLWEGLKEWRQGWDRLDAAEHGPPGMLQGEPSHGSGATGGIGSSRPDRPGEPVDRPACGEAGVRR
jgi:hypothetical protein